MGGNVTGAITGTIVPVGAAYEWIPEGPEGVRSVCYQPFTHLNHDDMTLISDAFRSTPTSGPSTPPPRLRVAPTAPQRSS